MGFFDRLKRLFFGEMPAVEATVERAYPETGAGDSELLEELAQAYGLTNKECGFDHMNNDPWWEGVMMGQMVALMSWGDMISLFVGEVEEITEVYLGRVGPDTPLPKEDSPQRLDRIVGEDGKALAQEFILLAYPKEEFDIPDLRIQTIRDSLPELSPAVSEVGFFTRGMQLFINEKQATLKNVDADLKLAVKMVSAMNG